MTSSMRGQIIRVNKDSVPPRDHIEDIMKTYDTCVGICFIEEGKLRSFKVNESMTVDSMMDVLEKLKEKSCIVWFGQCEDAYSEDDIQPFMSMNDQIAVFLDAPFEDYSHPENADSKHSQAFYAFHEYFQPEIEASAELADNDVEKVVTSLRGTAFKRKMDKELLKEGGCCLIYANNSTGEINQWCTNVTAVTPDWGWTSDDFSTPTEVEDVVVQEGEPKSKSLIDQLGSLIGKKTDLPKPNTDNNIKNLAAGGKPVSKMAEELKNSTAGLTTDKRIMWSPKMVPGHETWSNKRIKERYYHETGQLPENWKDLVEVAVLPKGHYRPKGFEALQVVHADPLPAPATEPKVVKPEDANPDTASRLPLLSREGHNKLDKIMKDKTFTKYLDNSSINVQDPEASAKIEKRVPFLEEQRGMKPGETLGWPLEAYEILCAECPEEAAILLMNRAGQMLSMQKAIHGLGQRLHKANKERLELKQKYAADTLSEEDKAAIASWKTTTPAASPSKPAAAPAAPAKPAAPAPAAPAARRMRAL